MAQAYPSGSKSFILKRKCNNPSMASTYMRVDIEYEDTGMFYLIIYRNGEYDVKNETDILIDEVDEDSGTKTGLAASKKVANKPLMKLKQQESRIMPKERESDDEDDSKLSISNAASRSPNSISTKSSSSKSISPTPPILVNADIDEEMDDEDDTSQTPNKSSKPFETN